jgi:hypothetical protein
MRDDSRKARREFLGQLGALAAAAALPATASASLPPRKGAAASPWDMSWVEKVTSAPYRCVIDSTNINDGAALDLAADVLDQFHEVYPSDQMRVVIVARQLGVPLALQDALWDRYGIGADRKVTDPVTKAAARRNPFLRPRPGAPGYEMEAKIEPLMARGLIMLVCNRAAMNTAHSFAEQTHREVEEVQAEVRAGLVPGALLMPDGIFALVRAQNAGCAMLKS